LLNGEGLPYRPGSIDPDGGSFAISAGYNLHPYEVDVSDALDVDSLNNLYRERSRTALRS
jgi:hypothetical protein